MLSCLEQCLSNCNGSPVDFVKMLVNAGDPEWDLKLCRSDRLPGVGEAGDPGATL